MAISYNRLWKRLIDHDLSKTDMMHRANISTNVLARLGKGAPVSMESMEKICKVLNCNIGDVMMRLVYHMLGVVNEIRIISNARIRKDCESEELCIERQKEAEKFLSEKVAAGLDQLLSDENLRLDLNTSRELFSLTGGGVRLNGEYVPVQAIKIDEALKAIPMPES